ncbi:MAG: hypothetical protein ACRD07_18150 [Acidimicrobiales bacterium]
MIERMRDAMLAAGSVTDDDIDEVIGALHDGDTPLSAYSPILVSARGRRPVAEEDLPGGRRSPSGA